MAPDRRRRRCERTRAGSCSSTACAGSTPGSGSKTTSGDVQPGLCASFAAGAVCCDERAEIISAEVGRGVFSTAPTATDIVASKATYPARMAASSDADGLMLAVHERMAQTEVAIAEAAASRHVDRSHRDRRSTARPSAHRRARSASSRATRSRISRPSCTGWSARSAHGQRTPVFTIGTTWSRHAWYLRLPGPGRFAVVGDRPVRVLVEPRAGRRDRAGEPVERRAPALRVRATQRHPRPAEPLSDRRPRARAAPPPGRPSPALPKSPPGRARKRATNSGCRAGHELTLSR